MQDPTGPYSLLPFVMTRIRAVVCVALLVLHTCGAWAATPPIGIFSDHLDVGDVKIPGAVEYDSTNDSFAISGSGTNMWFKTDAFHYVWKKVSGDNALSAAITFLGQSAEPQRKAFLMVRQSLEADSADADVVVHGDGLTSLQFRE